MIFANSPTTESGPPTEPSATSAKSYVLTHCCITTAFYTVHATQGPSTGDHLKSEPTNMRNMVLLDLWPATLNYFPHCSRATGAILEVNRLDWPPRSQPRLGSWQTYLNGPDGSHWPFCDIPRFLTLSRDIWRNLRKIWDRQ